MWRRNRKLALVTIPLLSVFLLAAVTQVNLATQVSGILPAPNGGIGSSALTAGSTVSMNFALGTVFTLTPAQTETINATGCTAGQRANLVILTSGTSSFTLTFSTNFRTTGTLATGTTTAKEFVVTFVCNGTTATEASRTAAE